MAEALQSQVSLFGGLYRWSDGESPLSDYKDRLDQPLAITLALPEPFTGLPPRQTVEVQVKEISTQEGWAAGGIDRMPGTQNSEPTLADITAGQDIYGWAATARFQDLEAATPYLTFNGIVAELDVATGTLTIENIDLAALATEVPRRRLIDLFPAADLSTAPTHDPRVIVVFKELRQVRLTKLLVAGGLYYYGAVRKASTGSVTFVTVYRDRKVVAGSEYSVVEYLPGLLVVRFTREQTDLSGRELEIRVDLTSTEFATQADCGKFVLNDATDGVGKPVNAASFSQAATDYTAASYTPGGGIGPEPLTAEAILKDLALRGAVIQLNGSGEYTWGVDKAALHTSAQYNGRAFGLGRGDGHWENIVKVTSLKKRRLEERPRSYTLQGLWSEGFGQGSYLLTTRASRTIPAGVELPAITNRFIGNLTTLRNECGYRLARLAAAEQQCSLEVINEARVISLNQTVPITTPGLRISASIYPLPWQCVRIVGGRDNWSLNFEGYDSGQYSAQAAFFQTAPAASVLTDYTFTPPGTPTGLTLGSAVVRAGDDGHWTVFKTIQVTAPSVNCSHLLFVARRQGSALRADEIMPPVALGATLSVELKLQPSQVYDFEIYAVNLANDPSAQYSVAATSLNHTAAATPTPTDPSAGSLNSSGTYQSSDGTTYAYFEVNLPSLSTNAKFLQVLYRQTGTSRWIKAGKSLTGSEIWRIEGLTPGLNYDVAVQPYSATTKSGNVITLTGIPFLAPGDTTVPSAGSAIAVRQAGAKVVEIDCTFTTPADWGITELFRNTTNDSGTATRIDVGKKKRFHDQNITYGTQYFYWFKVGDNTYVATGNASNLSGFSPSSLHSVTVVRNTTDDNADGSITNVKIGNDFNATKIIAGTLTVANSNGASEILIKSGASVAHLRLQNGATPAEIRFETVSSVIKGKIYGDSADDFYMIPGTENDNACNLGSGSKRWAYISLNSYGEIRLRSDGTSSPGSLVTIDTGDISCTGNNLGDFWIKDFDSLKMSGDLMINKVANGTLAAWVIVLKGGNGTVLGYIPVMTNYIP